MNINTNYGMTNYHMGFRAKGCNKVVKTMADLKRMAPNERNEYEAEKVLNKAHKMLMKMNIKPNCNNKDSVHEGVDSLGSLFSSRPSL